MNLVKLKDVYIWLMLCGVLRGPFAGGIAVGINKNTQNRKIYYLKKKGNSRLGNILSNELQQTRTVLNSRQMQWTVPKTMKTVEIKCCTSKQEMMYFYWEGHVCKLELISNHFRW